MKTKLKISPNFTIDDIHAIRYYNYEVTKDLSMADRIRYYNEPDFRKEVETRYLKRQDCIVSEIK
jgi:hypothetical protein